MGQKAQMADARKSLLIWLPVTLLPLENLITAEVTRQSILTGYNTSSPLIPFLPEAVVYILGAVTEELFYRWFLLKTVLLPRVKPVNAILIVSVIFSCMHLWNIRNGTELSTVLIQIVFSFSFSIWAGIVTWKSTWLIPLLAHVLVNATAGEEMLIITFIISMFILMNGVWLMKSYISIDLLLKIL